MFHSPKNTVPNVVKLPRPGCHGVQLDLMENVQHIMRSLFWACDPVIQMSSLCTNTVYIQQKLVSSLKVVNNILEYQHEHFFFFFFSMYLVDTSEPLLCAGTLPARENGSGLELPLSAVQISETLLELCVTVKEMSRSLIEIDFYFFSFSIVSHRYTGLLMAYFLWQHSSSRHPRLPLYWCFEQSNERPEPYMGIQRNKQNTCIVGPLYNTSK